MLLFPTRFRFAPTKNLVGGLAHEFYFPYIGNVIIRTDELIFSEVLKPPTRYGLNHHESLTTFYNLEMFRSRSGHLVALEPGRQRLLQGLPKASASGDGGSMGLCIIPW